MTAIATRHWLRRLVLLVLAVVAFKALEPLFVYRWGWRELPALTGAPVAEAADPARAAAIARARPLVQALQQRLRLPGIAIAVGLDGREVWAFASGYADLDAKKPLTLDAQFRIGSASKAFTSAAMATLVQAGKVDLDAPLQTYLPWFPAKPWPLSTRQVMSHTAGLRDYGLCACFPIWEYYNRTHYASLREAVASVANAPLRFAPGSGYAYTSLGYNLAGSVIESAAQQDFLGYLDRAVLQPLQLRHTRADDATADLPDRVQFYEVDGDEYKAAFAVDNSNKWPSGGLLSTPRDLVRFGNGILAGTVFDAATRERFWTEQKLADGSANGDHYALGWRVSDGHAWREGGRTTRLVSHNGVATGAPRASRCIRNTA